MKIIIAALISILASIGSNFLPNYIRAGLFTFAVYLDILFIMSL